MYTLTLDKGYTWETMAAVAAGVIALHVLFYLRSFRRLGVVLWTFLLTLRTLAIAVAVLLLFRPVLSVEKEVSNRRHLIFLVDTSASMGTADDPSGTSRFDQVRNQVKSWWGNLEKDFHLHLIEFSARASPLERPADLDDWKPTGQATSLVQGLTSAGQQVARGDVEAVILFSDGVHNAAGDPVACARQGGLVVHTVGVGNSLRGSAAYRDIRVTGVECPEELPVNNQARIKASIDSFGFDGRLVKVILEEDGKAIKEAELVLDGKAGTQEVTFDYLPTVKGRHVYTVRVPPAPEEKIKQNNHRSTSAQVVDLRIRVLYIEGSLRAEFGALVDRFLAKDPDIEFCALIRTRADMFVVRTNMAGLKLKGLPATAAELEQFDVFLLGDVDSNVLRPGLMGLLKKRVQTGAGLVMIGGYSSLGPGGYAGTPLEDVLPVFLGDRNVGQVTDAFLPALTPEGRQHPIFANIAPFFPGLKTPPATPGLPPLSGCVKVARAKPGAAVLAVYPGGAGGPMPVLAVQAAGKGRTGVFTGDTTRGWQQVPHALDQKSPFVRFWGQLLRWLANRSDAVASGISARTDKTYYAPDAPVNVHVVVRDQEGEGARQAEVTARLKGQGDQDQTLPLSGVSGPVGNFAGTFHPKAPGSYEIVVEAKLGQTTLKSDKLQFEVGRPNLEFDRLDLDEQMLTRIATETRGRYFHISTADRLLELLDRQGRKRHVVEEQRLYWPRPFWALFVGVLVVEWVVRKRSQLR